MVNIHEIIYFMDILIHRKFKLFFITFYNLHYNNTYCGSLRRGFSELLNIFYLGVLLPESISRGCYFMELMEEPL